MALIQPDEISSIIKSKIDNYELQTEVSNTGTVLEIGDGIARAYGLRNVMANELVQFEDGEGTLGIAMNLEEDNVGIVILGEYTNIKEGTVVKTTGRIASVPVGDGLIGRIVDPTGKPLDGKGDYSYSKTRPIERVAPGIVARRSVYQPLQTGLTAIDALTPIGRGQRELIIGDRQTGKTAIAIDTIINQKGKDVICIYVAIGQKASTVAQLAKTLEEHGAMAYSIIVSSTANESAPLQYIAPFAGVMIIDYFVIGKGNPAKWAPTKGINWAGMIALAIGVVAGLVIPWGIVSVNGVIVSAMATLILRKVMPAAKTTTLEDISIDMDE